MSKRFLKLTLISNGKPVIINPDAIAFAIEVSEPREEGAEPEIFTRVFLRQLQCAGESFPAWVDVVEKVTAI